jgi:hypothetical protein
MGGIGGGAGSAWSCAVCAAVSATVPLESVGWPVKAVNATPANTLTPNSGALSQRSGTVITPELALTGRADRPDVVHTHTP